jgi:hypothetical protein
MKSVANLSILRAERILQHGKKACPGSDAIQIGVLRS